MLKPSSVEATKLRVLPAGHSWAEGSTKDGVPLFAIALGVDELEDGVEIGSCLREGRVGGRNVPPPPSPDRVVSLSGHHDRRVDREVDDPAFVGHQIGGTGDGPVKPLQGADKSRRRTVHDPPWLGGAGGTSFGVVEASLEVVER